MALGTKSSHNPNLSISNHYTTTNEEINNAESLVEEIRMTPDTPSSNKASFNKNSNNSFNETYYTEEGLKQIKALQDLVEKIQDKQSKFDLPDTSLANSVKSTLKLSAYYSNDEVKLLTKMFNAIIARHGREQKQVKNSDDEIKGDIDNNKQRDIKKLSGLQEQLKLALRSMLYEINYALLTQTIKLITAICQSDTAKIQDIKQQISEANEILAKKSCAIQDDEPGSDGSEEKHTYTSELPIKSYSNQELQIKNYLKTAALLTKENLDLIQYYASSVIVANTTIPIQDNTENTIIALIKQCKNAQIILENFYKALEKLNDKEAIKELNGYYQDITTEFLNQLTKLTFVVGRKTLTKNIKRYIEDDFKPTKRMVCDDVNTQREKFLEQVKGTMKQKRNLALTCFSPWFTEFQDMIKQDYNHDVNEEYLEKKGKVNDYLKPATDFIKLTLKKTLNNSFKGKKVSPNLLNTFWRKAFFQPELPFNELSVYVIKFIQKQTTIMISKHNADLDESQSVRNDCINSEPLNDDNNSCNNIRRINSYSSMPNDLSLEPDQKKLSDKLSNQAKGCIKKQFLKILNNIKAKWANDKTAPTDIHNDLINLKSSFKQLTNLDDESIKKPYDNFYTRIQKAIQIREEIDYHDHYIFGWGKSMNRYQNLVNKVNDQDNKGGINIGKSAQRVLLLECCYAILLGKFSNEDYVDQDKDCINLLECLGVLTEDQNMLDTKSWAYKKKLCDTTKSEYQNFYNNCHFNTDETALEINAIRLCRNITEASKFGCSGIFGRGTKIGGMCYRSNPAIHDHATDIENLLLKEAAQTNP